MHVSRREVLKLSTASAALLLSGCPAAAPQNQPAASPGDDKPLRVLLVAPPEGYATKVERYWVSQSDAPFELRSATVEEALAAKRFKADVLVYPARLLGELAASERITPLSRTLTDGEELHAGDLLRHARTTEVTWGAATMAVCLGAPTYVLLYRKDLFEKLSLQPPQTWEEYQEVAARRSLAVCEPFGDGAEMVLLARAAAYVRNRSGYGGLFDLKTMQPLVDAAPYVRALEELVAAHQPAPKILTGDDCLQRLLAGECAMTWDWPAANSGVETTQDAGEIAVAPLPGSADVYDFRARKWLTRGADEAQRVPLLGAAGVLASVTTEARRPRAAENFLAWLSAGENAVELAAGRADTGPFRRSHLAQPRPWLPASLSSDATEQYVAAIGELHEQSTVLLAPRLPGEAEYCAALRTAVTAALAGKSAAAALAAATQAFNTITDRLGRDAQRSNYQRSLGLDV